MEPTPIETRQLNSTEQTLPGQLPEELQSYCNSGKSVSELAHLVKNIIQMVSGSAEIMKLGLERKQYDRVLRSWNIFEPNFIRLQKFILDLIKYTKHYTIQKTNCDINQILIKGIRSCEYFLKNKAVKIELHEDKTIPPIELDVAKIEEIVINLVTHAFDNLKDHMGKITIETHYITENHQVRLLVRDDGPLLTDEIILQITEPFERTRNMVGTGFDLPLVKLYVEQHNGYMEISGDETQGNLVSIYLPTE